ncbi:MAG: hypothetical protein JST82_08110 [Bacteroidetes bacterium]|nr:hypothetical protein [Bacteroidota bacterium]
MNAITTIIYYVSILSPLLGVWVGRNSKSILWYYMCTCFVADVINYNFKQMHISHVWISNLFIIVEFVFVTSYFKNVFFSKAHQQIFIAFLAIVAALFLYNSYTITAVDGDASKNYNYAFTAVFFIVYIMLSLAGLFKIMREAKVPRLQSSPLFLSCIAFLLYSSGALFIFLAKDEIVRIDKQAFAVIWPFFFMPLNITKNILVAFSLHNASSRNA